MNIPELGTKTTLTRIFAITNVFLSAILQFPTLCPLEIEVMEKIIFKEFLGATLDLDFPILLNSFPQNFNHQ